MIDMKEIQEGMTPTSRTSSSGNLFNGFFTHGRTWNFDKNNLIDSRGRRIFEMTERACEADVYPYQLPLEGRSGPWVQAEGRQMLMLSSYDYLGLIGDRRIDDAAIQAVHKYGTGTGGVRMLTGTLDLHHRLEKDIASFKGTAEAITFTSGYVANLAVISALLSPQDRVIMDSLSHRSLVDACRLAGVKLQRFRHNYPASLLAELESGASAHRTLIIADGVFSMDGDICRLPELIELKKKFDCFLSIDESHSSGVLGASGRGTDEHFGIDATDVDIWTGSLAKAIPSNGGLRCSFAGVSRILTARGRSVHLLCFSLPFSGPARHGQVSRSSISNPDGSSDCRANPKFLFRESLRNLGYDIGASETPIIPVMLREEPTAAFLARHLRERGIIVTPVMFPAVPMGSARLRLCVTAAHTTDDLQFAVDAFRELRP